MVRRRFIRWPLLVLAVLTGLVSGALFLLSLPSVQTHIAIRILRTVNASLRGQLDFERLAAHWDGRIEIYGASLLDTAGVVIATVDTVQSRVSLNELLADSIHFQSLTLRGVTASLEFDSAGALNIANAVTPAQSDTAVTVRAAWVVLVDQFVLTGLGLKLGYAGQSYVDAAAWSLAGNLSFAQDSLHYSATLAIPDWLRLDAGGEIAATPKFSADGLAGFILEHRALQQLDTPFVLLREVSGHAQYRLTSDTLVSVLDLRSAPFGHIQGNLALALNSFAPALRCSLVLDTVQPAFLWNDSTKLLLQGTVVAEKAPTADWVNGWTVQAQLIDPEYGDYRADFANLQATTQDSQLTMDATLGVSSGRATIRGQLAVFRKTEQSGQLYLTATNVPLHELRADIPDSIANVTGSATLTFAQREPAAMQAAVDFVLRNAGAGVWQGDSLRGSLHLQNGDFVLDTATVWVSGARADLAASWLAGGELQGTTFVQIPDLGTLRKLPLHITGLDSLHGTIHGELTVHGKTSTTGMSSLHLSGVLTADSVRYRDNAVGSSTIKIVDWMPDEKSVNGVAHLEHVRLSGQKVDSAAVEFRGTLDSLGVQLQLWVITDTVEARADLTVRFADSTWHIALHQLHANTYQVAWHTEGESNIDLRGTAATVDALIVQSPYGTLIASGTVARPGDQDLALEVSGIELADWSKLLHHSLPAGLLNARIMISGPDTNVSGELSATIDSVEYESQLLADRVTVDAVANSVATSFKALYSLHGDSIAFARGSLPARLTFADGFVLDSQLPMSGRVALYDHPWTLGFPVLPYGSSISGRVSGELSVLGSPARPDWLGMIACRDGRYKDTRYGLDYQNIKADIELHRDTLAISNLQLTSIGSLSGSGQAVLAFPLPKSLDLTLNFENFSAVDSRILRARVTGAAQLKGSLDSLRADGNVRFSEGVYRVTQSTTKEIEEIDLTAELARLRGDTTEQRGILVSRFYQPMSHAIYVDIPGNVWLRGSGMNVELFGGLWMYKDANMAPYMNGEIKVKRGTVEFAGHEFLTDQDSGTVVFTGPVDNPDLNIVAVEQSILRQSNDRIRIRIFGSLQNSQMELSGNRADGSVMTVEAVLQRLFGAFIPLASDQTGGSDLTGSITSAGISQLSNVVGKMAGLDVFQFRSGSGGLADLSGSSLEVGTYLTDRLFVRVLQPIESVQGTQDVLVEYRLFDWLKLAGHQTGTKSSEFKTVLQWEWR